MLIIANRSESTWTDATKYYLQRGLKMSLYTEVIQVEGLDESFIGRTIGPFTVQPFDCDDTTKAFECLKELNVRYHMRNVLGKNQKPMILSFVRNVSLNPQDKIETLETDMLLLMLLLHLVNVTINDAVVISGTMFDENKICNENKWDTVFEQVAMESGERLAINHKQISPLKLDELYNLLERYLKEKDDSKKKAILTMYASSLYILAQNPKFIAMTSVLDMFRDGSDKKDVTKRLAKLMMNYLNDVHGVYNKVQRIYEVRSNYIHQGNGGEIFNEMDIVNELCVRAIWKMINPETNIDKLEEDCKNNCSYSYF